MRVNLAGKKQGNLIHAKPNPALSTFWGESEYYLDLENEDKK